MKRITLALVLTLLSGCGFQLRDNGTAGIDAGTTLPIRVVGVSAYSDFASALSFALKREGLGLAEEADLTLIIKPVEFSQNTLTVGESLRIADYDVSGRVRYQLIFKNDPESAADELAASDEFDRIIEASQRLDYDPEAPLASRAERDETEQALYQELASRLARRVALRVQALKS
jgi:outer membrane lipopolysaccharide assembly protein LptE/RlpB